MSAVATPERDCGLCPRLASFRAAARAAEPSWFNAPVPTFGTLDARVLVVGLAPGLRGANRTGRPFTGDYAGELLYASLLELGFAEGAYDRRPDDGLELRDLAITNAVRCVPPQNKPTPLEIRTCRVFLEALLAAMPNLLAIFALGRIAHESVVRTLGARLTSVPFGHGRRHDVEMQGRALALFDSYHCSRYNTNTGVLTTDMFLAALRDVHAYVSER